MNMHSAVRRSAVTGLLLVVLMMLVTGGALAQTGATRKVKIGDRVNGSLDARTFAQSYSFDAVSGDTINITATSNTRAIFLALLLTDASGNPLQQVAELTRPEVSIQNFRPQTGTYYITVFRATGVQNNTVSAFTLALTGTAAPTPGTSGSIATGAPIQTVELTQGMTVSLSWSSSDDLNLEVRDPIGGAINLNSTSASSGGRFGGNVNGECGTATNNSPTERVDWGRGNVPQGSYEIIVYFVKPCTQTVAPNNFTVSVTKDGTAATPITGTLERDGQNYVASFIIGADGAVTSNNGGVNTASTGLDVNAFAAEVNAPTAFTGTQVTGRIDRNNGADVYSVELAQGDSFAVTLNAINGGSLDPYLVLIGPTNQIIADNDDADASTRNSRIEQRNVAAGTYRVLATRFGLVNGGTEGDYALAITRGTGGQVVAPLPTAGAGTAVAIPTVAPGVAAIPTVGAGGGTLPRGNIEVLLTWDSRSDVRMLIRDPRGASLYSDRTRTDIGGQLVALGNFRCQNTTLTPVTYAYWPAATRITAGTYEIQIFRDNLCGEELAPNLNLKVTIGGKEVINQVTGSPTEGEKFITTFTVDANGNATAGPFGFFNNTFTTDIASAITSAAEVTFGGARDGELTAGAPYQLYFFKGVAGDKVTITMKRNVSILDPYLFLLAPDGKTLLAFNDDNSAASNAPGGPVAPPDSQIKAFTLLEDGNYIVVATRFGAELGGTVGKYRLTLNR
jgi:hypothetical protein